MQAADYSRFIAFPDLGLSPVLLHIGSFDLRWYSIAYLAGIFVGYWYLLKLLKQPGAPMARRHADDLVFYASLGIIVGGRLGYVLFYNLGYYLHHPIDILKLWDGGMSFHGGVIGTSLAIIYLARKEKLQWLRIHDYVACTVPFGLFFGRLANFVNGELWGHQSDVPWAMIFPSDPLQLPRHPSQLYEAGLEGALLVAVMLLLFWKTSARWRPSCAVRRRSSSPASASSAGGSSWRRWPAACRRSWSTTAGRANWSRRSAASGCPWRPVSGWYRPCARRWRPWRPTPSVAGG